MSRGFSDPMWMAKLGIIRVPQPLLVKAICDLFDWLNEDDFRESISGFEVMDRLIQVAGTGEYKPPPMDIFNTFEGGEDLSKEQEKIVEDFKEQMREVFGDDEDDDELPESD